MWARQHAKVGVQRKSNVWCTYLPSSFSDSCKEKKTPVRAISFTKQDLHNFLHWLRMQRPPSTNNATISFSKTFKFVPVFKVVVLIQKPLILGENALTLLNTRLLETHKLMNRSPHYLFPNRSLTPPLLGDCWLRWMGARGEHFPGLSGLWVWSELSVRVTADSFAVKSTHCEWPLREARPNEGEKASARKECPPI